MRVKDKVIVVTGGAHGIGAAMCRRFKHEGAKGVVVVEAGPMGSPLLLPKPMPPAIINPTKTTINTVKILYCIMEYRDMATSNHHLTELRLNRSDPWNLTSTVLCHSIKKFFPSIKTAITGPVPEIGSEVLRII